MKPAEAEKLLGGYATGTLTEDERQGLFASALDHQETFDALMDEEALRDLLADPAVKAQLILALAHSASPRVVPFWRRTGVLSVAASLLVAATAGLVYLRSPDKTPPPLREDSPKASKEKTPEAPASAPAIRGPERKTAPTEKAKEAPAPVPLAETAAAAPPPTVRQPVAAPAPMAAAPASMPEACAKAKEDLRAAATQDHLAKKAEATRSASAAVEVIANHQEAAAERKAVAQDRVAGGAVGGAVGGVVSGVVGSAPWWQVEAGPDGITQVTVQARRDAVLVLIKRGPDGVVVIPLRPEAPVKGNLLSWHCELRLAPGEVLDLYRLNQSVAEPSLLPETGPVDGLRVRIHPVAKKNPPR